MNFHFVCYFLFSDVAKAWVDERQGYLHANPVPHSGCTSTTFTTNSLGKHLASHPWTLRTRAKRARINRKKSSALEV